MDRQAYTKSCSPPNDNQAPMESEHGTTPVVQNRDTQSSPTSPSVDNEPLISLEWSLNPSAHSSSNETAPVLSLFLTLHARIPITIYNEHLDPSRLLSEGRFSIFDLTTETEVPQAKSRFCDFEPPSKVHVPLRENMFYTLYPGIPTPLRTSFGRGSKIRPRPKEENQEGDGSKQAMAKGVHGLAIGHRYRLTIRRTGGWAPVRWWEYGEREEVINPPTGRLDGRKVAYRRAQNPHDGLPVDGSGLVPILFQCIE
ncbi:MAG: hypothetical protein OHK93_002621 [Ramalina farinacea]|uniref:Uncharacterized protein n=1 Tax=Ramalina farinacea TaxID=258253 RepID=A0AA43QRX6_9LECA|nr:hypothetical protein [Ramalina farinacea]